MDETKDLVSNTPISPSTVAKMFQLEYPKFPLIVRGEVTGLRPYRKNQSGDPICYYGDISDDDFTIEFKVPPSDKLTTAGQYIEIVGSIKANPSKSQKLITPRLEGQVVDVLTPPKRATLVLDDDVDMDSKVSLKSFLEQYKTIQLAFLSTKNGFNDFVQGCNDSYKTNSLTRHKCSFSGKENIISSLRQVRDNPTIKGIVILRGGRTSNDDLRLWNDIEIIQELYKLNMPFYTGIGHASDILLVDKHAHESFTTPTMFGNKFREVLNQIYWDNERDNKIKELESELIKQTPKIKKLQKLLIWGAVILIVILVIEVKLSFIDKFISYLTN